MASLVRTDEHGLYVLTGGYAFRPPADTKFVAGDHARSHHVGGTQTAKVGSETWRSYAGDPQYIKYVWKDRERNPVDVERYLELHPEQSFPPKSDNLDPMPLAVYINGDHTSKPVTRMSGPNDFQIPFYDRSEVAFEPRPEFEQDYAKYLEAWK